MSLDGSVVVVGLGYIGLPTAAILATNGVTVLGVDVNPATVAAVNAGQVPFVEPDLADDVHDAVARGTLRAAREPVAADAYILAVPTPFVADHQPDLSFIEAAARSIAPTVPPGALVILESTSPPGATARMSEWILESRPDLVGDDGEPLIHVAHCPERVLPGRVMLELVSNDRIVGGITPAAADRAKQLYETFCRGEILTTDALTAELTKLTENAFRDVNIAFANELSLIADRIGVDVWELVALANHHPRVNILQPGPGVGGHCIAVDPWFIVAAAPDQARLVRTAREINDAKPRWVIDKVLTALSGREKPTVAALGLTFKADIDDLRESPARKIVAELADDLPHGTLLAVEPYVSELPPELAERQNVVLVPLEKAISAADVVVVLVDHTPFRERPRLRDGVVVVDTKGLWS